MGLLPSFKDSLRSRSSNRLQLSPTVHCVELKNKSVQCLLLGAATTHQFYHALYGLQLLPKLNSNVMAELERILDNKPVRPPMVSNLAMR
ncbi:hypothetical protein ACI65C_011270 [Semiaphis heraclei]